MNEKQKAKIIFKTLNKIYPKAPVPLKSKNTFTLLISVLLSAQCTDVNVNNVTKDIYPKYYKPEHFVKLGRKKIEKLIKKIGIFRVKAKSIYLMSKQVLERHKGKVPKTFEELEKLPGVGHKTASVVMSQGFGYPAFAVDTHIHRLAQRWGLTNGKNKNLYNLIGKKFLNKKSFPYGKKINFNSIRKGEIIGEHEVKFSSGKEIITLNHEAFDRELYSDGALTASKWLMKKKPGLYSMRDLLNFS